jgi:hypothetical protein
MDHNYIDDELDAARRAFQSMGPSNLNSFSTTYTYGGGNRSSVLNPFTNQGSASHNMIVVNQTLDGRRSVSPMI